MAPKFLLLLLAAVLLFGLVFFVRSFARVLAFPGSRLALPDPARVDPRTRILTFETADGLTLRAAWVSSGVPGAKVAIYFHGNAEAAVQNLPLAAALADGGLDTVVAEYRGYGGQAGRPSETGLYTDGAALLSALGRDGVTPARIVLIGRSLGSGVAVELALRTSPSLVILVSPYTSFPDMGRTLVGPLAPLVVPDRFDNLAKIGKLACPVVILHGTRDEVVPFRMGEALARAGRKVRFVPLEGRTHNDIPDLASLLLSAVRYATAG